MRYTECMQTEEISISTSLAVIDPEDIPIPSKIVALLGGGSQLHPLILQSLFLHAAREPIGVLIGDNHFNAFALSHMARRCAMDPTALLKRIDFSRAFTCHQFHHGVMNLITPNISRWRALYVLGLVRLFDDEDIEFAEASRLVDEILVRLREVAAQGLSVLVTAAPPNIPERGVFIERLVRTADAYWQPSPMVVEHFAQQPTLW